MRLPLALAASLALALCATAVAPTASALPPCYQIGSHSGPVYLHFAVCAQSGSVRLVFCTQAIDHVDPPVPDLDRCYVSLG